MALTQEEIQGIATVAAQKVIEAAGLTSGMISEREALRRFKPWFRGAVKAGKIAPATIGSGRTGTRCYQLSDILAYQEAEKQKARLQIQVAAAEYERSFV